jgi:arylsulfatase A-like enzyme
MQTRREFLSTALKGTAYALAASGIRGAVVAKEGAAGFPRPNVLFIAIDDLNDWIGCLAGHPDTRTPNIDRLARRGVLFTHAYCSAPACNPSRASLLTGILPSTSGVYHNDQPWRPVMPKAITLPQHFMAHGYHVVGRGKIFHGAYPDPTSWHEYIARGPDPMPPGRPLNGIPKTAHFDWGPVDVSDEEMDDVKVVKWAINYLNRKHDRPFFLGCGLFRPHLPWYVPRKYFDMYPPEKVTLPNVKEDDLDDVPPVGRQMARPQGDHRKVVETNNWRKAVSAYLACIRFTDTNVGRLLDSLDRSPYASNTVIVLWGDHGWHLGEKLHWRKFALWEEATHAPLIVADPRLGKAATQCERTVSFIDIYPTLVELCGLSPIKELEGVSLAPLLKKPSAPWERPALTTHGRNNHSVRSERWRYIRYRDGTEELYDHANDPLEWTNLAGKPEFAEVKEKLAHWLPKTDAEDAPRERRPSARKNKRSYSQVGRRIFLSVPTRSV